MDVVKLMESNTTTKGHFDDEDVKPILAPHYWELSMIVVVSKQ
jgi:hypothetical protein